MAQILGPDPEDRFWYLTLYNENYVMPPLPEGDDGAVRRRDPATACTASRRRPDGGRTRARCHAAVLRADVERGAEAQRLLAERLGVAADAWSVTS